MYGYKNPAEKKYLEKKKKSKKILKNLNENNVKKQEMFAKMNAYDDYGDDED